MDSETLLKAFEPPEDYVGQVCICCALSADQIFMEDAVKRFTNYRIFDGAASVYLMLDKKGTLLDTQLIKGLVQLQAKPDESIRVQHAKVALMQFAKRARCASKLKLTNDTMWRLVVSTGNWTRESARNNIEMVWKGDFYTKNETIDRQLLADLFKANEFFTELRKHYVCNDALWNRAKLLGDCLTQYKEEHDIQRMAPSRFFSSIDGSPLLGSIESQFKRDGIKRNFIQVGSGFYEKGEDSSKPDVIKLFDAFLRDRNVFSIRPAYKKIVVNRSSANRLACWEKSDWDGWELFDIKDPVKIKDEESRRSFLHAKYICLGNFRGNKLSDCKFYVGSGNLTKMGLLSAYGRAPFKLSGAGNVEAGIVVDVTPEDAKFLLTHGNAIKNTEVLESTPGEPEETDVVPICPLNAFELDGNNLKPVWNDREDISDLKAFCSVVTDVGETQILPLDEALIEYPDSQPVSILVKWNDVDYWIPVVTAEGNMPLPQLKVNGIDDLLGAIADFPNREDEEPDGGDDVVEHKEHASTSSFHDDVQKDVFPIQLSMKLVEGIAKRCETIDDALVDDFIDTLERYMDALPSAEIETMKGMKVNFLSVLTAKGFAPPLEKERSRWNEFVTRISQKWGLKEWIGLK